MIWVALALTVVAVTGVVTATPDRLPASALGFWWFSSFTAQAFALPLMLTCLGLILAGDGPAPWLLAIATALFGLAHFRNRRAGRLMLHAVGRSQARLPLHVGLLPLLTGRRSTRRISNIAYGSAGEANLLDLVLPRSALPGPMPILIHIHGGAWVVGAKNQQAKPLLHHMAARGWVCVDINYRMGPAHRGPDWIVDVLRAVAWTRDHAEQYGGDPARIAIAGGSAGGHLAALAALVHDDPALKPGFEQADCSVRAAIALYGRYDFLDRSNRLGRNHQAVIEGFMAEKVMPGAPDKCRELWRAVSPLDRVRSDAPRMLIAHGTGDTMLPFEDAVDFAAALGEVSAQEVRFVALPGIQHAWDMVNSALAWAHVRAIEAFLAPMAKPD